jgi:hypothetical protein
MKDIAKIVLILALLPIYSCGSVSENNKETPQITEVVTQDIAISTTVATNNAKEYVYSMAYRYLNKYLGKDIASIQDRFKKSSDVEFINNTRLRQWGYDPRYSFAALIKFDDYGEVCFVLTAHNWEGVIDEVYITCDESFGDDINEDFKRDGYFCEFTIPNENGSTSKFIEMEYTNKQRVAVVKNTLWMMEIKCNEVKLY